MAIGWNLWHGCHKKSEGCKFCYVYRSDERFGKDARIIKKNQNFNLPIRKNKNGEYRVKPNQLVYTCFTSDFFLEDADDFRIEAWNMIRERRDLNFLFLTKRIERFHINLPADWNDGWDNVIIGCTCENQRRTDERLPIFMSLPIKHKIIICEPLLEDINLSNHLNNTIEEIIVGGESGNQARICDYNWVMHIRKQSIENNISFYFKQTGANFKINEKVYNIKREHQHSQAQKANINFQGNENLVIN